MVHVVSHKIFRIAETRINEHILHDMLVEIGAPDWQTDTKGDAATLTEVMGRLCYKAFGVGLNKNITKVREGNEQYVGNLLAQKHGSVLEHSYVTLAMLNVSRVLTHELVRHRPNNFSQESLRFVRLEELGVYMPQAFEAEHLRPYYQYGVKSGMDENTWIKDRSDALKDSFLEGFRIFEEWVERKSELLGLNNPDMPFNLKKKLTSALRRRAPHGLTTNIGATGNHRAWRYEIEARTSPGAEEEIQAVFYDVALMFADLYPSIYQDIYIPDTCGPVTFKHQKV